MNDMNQFTISDGRSSDPYSWIVENTPWRDVEQAGVENYVRDFVRGFINGCNASDISDTVIYRNWRKGGEFKDVVAFVTSWLYHQRKNVETEIVIQVHQDGAFILYRKFYGPRGGHKWTQITRENATGGLLKVWLLEGEYKMVYMRKGFPISSQEFVVTDNVEPEIPVHQ